MYMKQAPIRAYIANEDLGFFAIAKLSRSAVQHVIIKIKGIPKRVTIGSSNCP